jgi:RNA polymerase sigma-70 factor (ECF subfamily)
LYACSHAARWDLSKERFLDALERSVRYRFLGHPPPAEEIEAYLSSLHAKDLALASACAAGSEAAWEYFFRAYRDSLYAAAGAITGRGADDASARELADSVYAELYGVSKGNDRRSLFLYFHGRSKLGTWLRAVLAQRHVDTVRAAWRLAQLPGGEVDATLSPLLRHPAPAPPDPHRQRYLALLRAALDAALSTLDARDRLRVSLYYAEGWTLAQIGKQLGEHEGTVSRRLEGIRRKLRGMVEDLLRTGEPAAQRADGRPGLSNAQIQLCFEYALEDWPFDLRRALESSEPAKAKLDEIG